MNNIKYILIFGCNGVRLTMQFNDLHSAYNYIITHKIEAGHYELFKAEKIISEDI